MATELRQQAVLCSIAGSIDGVYDDELDGFWAGVGDEISFTDAQTDEVIRFKVVPEGFKPGPADVIGCLPR